MVRQIEAANSNPFLARIARRYGFVHGVALSQVHAGGCRAHHVFLHGDIPGRLVPWIGYVADRVWSIGFNDSDMGSRILVPLDTVVGSVGPGEPLEPWQILREMLVEEFAALPVRDRNGTCGLILFLAGAVEFNADDLEQLHFVANAHFDSQCRGLRSGSARPGTYAVENAAGPRYAEVRDVWAAGASVHAGPAPAGFHGAANANSPRRVRSGKP